MAYTNHFCKCANNQSGQCYGKNRNGNYSLEVYHNRIARGINDVVVETQNEGTDQEQVIRRAFVETDCPGYIAPGQPPFEGVTQGKKVVKPFN